MKIKNGFILREAAGSYVVMRLGGETDLRKMITLNETGAVIWKAIDEGLGEEDIARRIAEEYEVDEKTALRDVQAFINKMSEADVLE